MLFFAWPGMHSNPMKPYSNQEPIHTGVSKNRGFYPQNGWCIKMENPIKMDDLEGFYTPIFGSTPIPITHTLNPPLQSCKGPILASNIDCRSSSLDEGTVSGNGGKLDLQRYPP